MTGIAEDADLDRMSDFDLVGGEVSPLDIGRPIAVGSMKAAAVLMRSPPATDPPSPRFRSPLTTAAT